MISKIKELGYYILAKYYFIGIVISVFVFEIVKQLLSSNLSSVNQIFGREFVILLISTTVGAFVGGIIFIRLTLKNTKQQDINNELWNNYNSNGYKPFLLRNIVLFSLAGFIGLLTKNAFEMKNHNFSSLFSIENSINYTSIFFAGIVFGLFMSFGKIKQLKHMFSDR